MIIAADPQAWTLRQRLPIHQRILPLPSEVCDFVRQVNEASGLAAMPAPVAPGPAWRRDLETAIRGMPERVLGLVDPLLLGVCLGRGLGSSGITDIVVDAGGRMLGCIVLLDAELLAAHGANSWATWKENLPFVPVDEHRLAATIAAPGEDTRANAAQYLLLHEFGHVLTAGAGFLPKWWQVLGDEQAEDFAFLGLSWGLACSPSRAGGPRRRFAALPGSDFALRDRVDFYGNAKLGSDAIIAAYAGLEESDHASLYGATNPYDDFAECFASYVHCALLGRPHIVEIQADGVALARLDGFWDSPRSAAKRRFMRALLGEARPARPAPRERRGAPVPA